jgi:hypothetical protein
MNALKEFAEGVLAVFAVLGFLYLKLKTFEGRGANEDLLERSKIRTLFDKERDRIKF